MSDLAALERIEEKIDYLIDRDGEAERPQGRLEEREFIINLIERYSMDHFPHQSTGAQVCGMIIAAIRTS